MPDSVSQLMLVHDRRWFVWIWAFFLYPLGIYGLAGVLLKSFGIELFGFSTIPSSSAWETQGFVTIVLLLWIGGARSIYRQAVSDGVVLRLTERGVETPGVTKIDWEHLSHISEGFAFIKIHRNGDQQACIRLSAPHINRSEWRAAKKVIESKKGD